MQRPRGIQINGIVAETIAFPTWQIFERTDYLIRVNTERARTRYLRPHRNAIASNFFSARRVQMSQTNSFRSRCGKKCAETGSRPKLGENGDARGAGWKNNGRVGLSQGFSRANVQRYRGKNERHGRKLIFHGPPG
jgi:hypothetical protein